MCSLFVDIILVYAEETVFEASFSSGWKRVRAYFFLFWSHFWAALFYKKEEVGSEETFVYSFRGSANVAVDGNFRKFKSNLFIEWKVFIVTTSAAIFGLK